MLTQLRSINFSIGPQVLFLAFAALESSECAALGEPDEVQTYYVTNPRSLDYKFVGKKDEHRFGVELKENKQFHHTRTGSESSGLIEINLFYDYYFHLIS